MNSFATGIDEYIHTKLGIILLEYFFKHLGGQTFLNVTPFLLFISVRVLLQVLFKIDLNGL